MALTIPDAGFSPRGYRNIHNDDERYPVGTSFGVTVTKATGNTPVTIKLQVLEPPRRAPLFGGRKVWRTLFERRMSDDADFPSLLGKHVVEDADVSSDNGAQLRVVATRPEQLGGNERYGFRVSSAKGKA